MHPGGEYSTSLVEMHFPSERSLSRLTSTSVPLRPFSHLALTLRGASTAQARSCELDFPQVHRLQGPVAERLRMSEILGVGMAGNFAGGRVLSTSENTRFDVAQRVQLRACSGKRASEQRWIDCIRPKSSCARVRWVAARVERQRILST